MLLPGGVGGVTGGGEILGAEATPGPGAFELTEALGASEGPQAVKIEIRTAAIVVRTGQWYGRGPLAQRRGGGTGRRVGLKNRCPQGRAGSTPALGTMPVLNGLDRHKVASRRRRSKPVGGHAISSRARAVARGADWGGGGRDRKSTRLNSSHRTISYAVFCLK